MTISPEAELFGERIYQMAQVINKIALLRKLETIKSALATQNRSLVATSRQELALLVNLGADDLLSGAVNKVVQLSGKWTRGSVDIEPAEVKEAVEEAIALLGR
jgi:hypothetical protein